MLSDDDLSEAQIYVTIQAYDRFASEYAKKWEWNPKTIVEIKKYNIIPFVRHAKPGGNVLIVECQSGRDYKLLTEAGFSCLGVSFSYGLLTEAVKRIPGGLFVHLNTRPLPFMPESLDAIYADALTSVPKRHMRDTLKDFRIFLRSNGILYLSLKLGTSHVMMMEDLGGKRYFTLYQKKEITSMVEGSGFHILWSEESPNTDPSLPPWFSLVAKKT